MSLREYIWDFLQLDHELNYLGITRASLFSGGAPDSPRGTLDNWVVLRWGQELPRAGRDTTVRPVGLTVWAYDRQPDYDRIDRILKRICHLFLQMPAIQHTTNGGWITEIQDNGSSEDLWDDGYNAPTKNWAFTIIASEEQA